MWTHLNMLIDASFLTYFMGINGYYFILIVFALGEISKRKKTRLPELDSDKMASQNVPPISVLVPAYNEANVIETTVKALLATDYPGLEVIVINDGSSDDTAEIVKEIFDLAPTNRIIHQQFDTEPIDEVYEAKDFDEVPVVLIDKANGGKSDALNAGINASRSPLFCSIDADTMVAKDSFLRLVEPFLYNPNEVVAAGGTVRLANGCRLEGDEIQFEELPESWLARFQIIEYLRAFLFGRMGLNRVRGNFIISGAFGLFNKQAVLEVGGYETGTVGEDMDLIVRLHRHIRQAGNNGRVVQIPEPVCFTEAPETFEMLRNQRDRWHRGLAESLWRHRGIFMNPKYGTAGMVIFPIFVFIELLGPVIELMGLVWFSLGLLFGFVNYPFAALFFFAAFLLSAIVSVLALAADKWSFSIFDNVNSMKLLVAASLESFGYRQLTMIYRIRGLFGLLAGREAWGEMTRKSRDVFWDSEEKPASS